MQKASNIVTKWTGNEGLNICHNKFTIIASTRRKDLEGEGLDTVGYLELVFRNALIGHWK